MTFLHIASEIVVVIAGLSLGALFIPALIKLIIVERRIENKEDELDGVEAKVDEGLFVMAVDEYRAKLIEDAKKPLLRDLERLKQRRQYILDKLPF